MKLLNLKSQGQLPELRIRASTQGLVTFPEADSDLARDLENHALRARREAAGSMMTYFWRASQNLYRITIDVSESRTGKLANLLATPADPPWDLSLRELEILTSLAIGHTNPEIAELLFISRRTVATHVEHILQKLNVPTRSGAGTIAVAEGALVGPFPSGQIELGPVSRITVDRSEFPSGRLPSPMRRTLKKTPIRLGAIYPEYCAEDDALATQRGAQLAIETINARGGVDGRPVEHIAVRVPTDDPNELSEALSKLMQQDLNAITLGLFPPHGREVAIAELSRIRIPVLHSMVSSMLSEQVESGGGAFDTIFQVTSSEENYLRGFSRTMASPALSDARAGRNGRLVVLLREHSSTSTVQRMLDWIDATGSWSEVSYVTVKEDSQSWAAAADELRNFDPDTVFVGSYRQSDLVAFLQSLRTAQVSPMVYATWVPSIPNFVRNHADLMEGVYWATTRGLYDDPLAGKFKREYNRRYADDPGYGSAAIHYDMVNTLSHSWSMSGSPWDFAGVCDSLRAYVHRGVAGSYFFGGPGQRNLSYIDETMDLSLAHAHLVYQVQKGVSRLIAPSELVVQP